MGTFPHSYGERGGGKSFHPTTSFNSNSPQSESSSVLNNSNQYEPPLLPTPITSIPPSIATITPTHNPPRSRISTLMSNRARFEETSLSFVAPSPIDGKRIAICPISSIHSEIEYWKNDVVV